MKNIIFFKRGLSILLTSAALLLFSSYTAHTALIFSDDFDSYTTNQIVPTTNWTNVLGNTPGTNTTYIQQDTGDIFGKGTSNQYVDIFDNSSSASTYLTKTGLNITGGIATLNMNIYEPAGTSTGRILIGIGDGVMAGNGSTSFDRANNINWNENPVGASTYGGASVSLDTLYNLNVVFNNTGAAINYGSPTGTQELNATSADIWIDGVLVAQNVTQDRVWGVKGDTFDSVGFRSFSGDQQRLLVDDFQVYDTAVVVPEPSVFALLTMGLGALYLRRRRQ